MKVYGTKEGKLYIKPIELFSQAKIQELIMRVSKADLTKRNKK